VRTEEKPWRTRVRDLERETSAPKRRRSRKKTSSLGAMLSTSFVMAFVIALAIGSNCGRLSAKISGYEEVAFEPLKRCLLARSTLGEGIGVPMVGCQTGSTQTSVSSGSAIWKMSVAGTKARGTYKFSALKEDGRWVLRNAQLDVGERSIDIVTCRDFVYR